MAVLFNRNTDVQSSHESSGAVSAIARPSPLRLEYPSSSLPAVGRSVLAQIDFGVTPTTRATPHPCATVALHPLDGRPSREVWTSDLPVTYGQQADIQFSLNDEFLFGVVTDPIDVNSLQFEDRVKKIYDAIFAFVESKRYPHLLRIWNYFPTVNSEFDGLENYQRFCRARSLAFQDHYDNFVDHLPSASAVGTLGGALVVYFIAARSAGLHRENPRQLSAYSYPPQYGPRSPSFARATLKRSGALETFFISGTASIVGHVSLHPENVAAQVDEALNNVEALIDSTHRDQATRFRGMQDLDNLKVYIRHPADLAAVREVVQRRMRPNADVLYLQGDICRAELLVEVEATLSSG